ncbi:hypothetical protein Pla144_37190 [Bythopirellula polymerisocia]|uniref:Uncharacterized protein n=1 Tax=Bythopirellula polymerisocia TaxID=2528003 RepID=A0A5C6CJ97_9BACT|nr:hypothetical protein Pla144_37190 [Bythopirellula polymerisocia]
MSHIGLDVARFPKKLPLVRPLQCAYRKAPSGRLHKPFLQKDLEDSETRIRPSPARQTSSLPLHLGLLMHRMAG